MNYNRFRLKYSLKNDDIYREEEYMVNISRIANFAKSHSVRRAVRALGRAVGVATLGFVSQTCTTSKVTQPAPTSTSTVEIPYANGVSNTSIFDSSSERLGNEIILVDIAGKKVDIKQLGYLSLFARDNGIKLKEILSRSRVDKNGSVTDIYLRGTHIANINALAELRNLTRLDLFGAGISNIRPLAELRNLTELDLGMTNISSIRPLAGLYNLRVLELYKTKVSDVQPLANLHNLRVLSLAKTPVSNIDHLGNLLKLKLLDLRGAPARNNKGPYISRILFIPPGGLVKNYVWIDRDGMTIKMKSGTMLRIVY